MVGMVRSKYRMMGKAPRLSTMAKTALWGESARELGQANGSFSVPTLGILGKYHKPRDYSKEVFGLRINNFRKNGVESFSPP